MNYLITGAGSGIGRAIAIKIAKNSHTCFLMGRNENNLKETLSALVGGNHKIFVVDIADENSLKIIIQQNADLVLEGVIANAGVGGENNFGENDRWNEIIGTNLTGTYYTIQ